jgi:hypothetical protein
LEEYGQLKNHHQSYLATKEVFDKYLVKAERSEAKYVAAMAGSMGAGAVIPPPPPSFPPPPPHPSRFSSATLPVQNLSFGSLGLGGLMRRNFVPETPAGNSTATSASVYLMQLKERRQGDEEAMLSAEQDMESIGWTEGLNQKRRDFSKELETLERKDERLNRNVNEVIKYINDTISNEISKAVRVIEVDSEHMGNRVTMLENVIATINTKMKGDRALERQALIQQLDMVPRARSYEGIKENIEMISHIVDQVKSHNEVYKGKVVLMDEARLLTALYKSLPSGSDYANIRSTIENMNSEEEWEKVVEVTMAIVTKKLAHARILMGGETGKAHGAVVGDKRGNDEDGDKYLEYQKTKKCYAFMEGKCTRGESCRFSHNEGNNSQAWRKNENTPPTSPRKSGSRSPSPVVAFRK